MATANAAGLSEQVIYWEDRVKAARRDGNVTAALNIAREAADVIEGMVDTSTSWTEEELAALTAVKRFTFNAAADAWPGWSLDSPELDTHSLVAGRDLAQRSLGWVEKLELGAIQEGTGIWLAGAFDLALGQKDIALARFSASRQLYEAAQAPGLVLLVAGYEVIARGSAATGDSTDTGKELEAIFAQIKAGEFKDGSQWVEQLRTAWGVFSR